MWKLDKFKDNKALIDEQGNSLTYSELNQESTKLFKIINKTYGNAFCSYFLGNRFCSSIPYIRTDNVTFLLLPLQKAKEEKDGSVIPHTRSIYWDIRCK